VFELLRGKTLDLKLEEGPLPVQEAVHIATEVARGLAHAHAEGVIHRDLKPANVFVTNKGQVKILDFGMAHAFGRRRLSGGTPAYMAPEQWEDAPEDERTDVFALGVMLYRMLTGDYPFPEGKGRWSSEPATVRKLDVPGAPELAELVEKMLDPVPTHRPRDGAAVLAALTPIEDRLRAKPADGSPPVHAKRRKATFGDLLAELRRRHVFRVMIGYGVFAFAVLQVTEPIMHGADLPNWVLKAVLVALVLGFPVAVILAWVFDLTAQGVKRTPSSTDPGAPRFGRSRLLLPLTVSAVVLAIGAAGAGGWYAWKEAGGQRSASAVPGAAPSIAVLPFKDLSPNHDQEYFSEGMAEEILTALSKVKGLRVPGRASSFYFKGKDVEPGEIARKLGVAHLLAGSVRRSGNKLRITAEVVRASDGERIWSQSFNRDLTDLFATQDEISRDVVEALRVKLVPGESPPPKEYRTSSQAAYESYLLSLHFGRSFSRGSIQHAVAAAEKAVALDPSFVQAWARLANGRLMAGILGVTPWDEARREALRAAERAVTLGPDAPVAYGARLWPRVMEWDWRGARADVDRTQELEPDSEISNASMLMYLFWTGQFPESLPLFQRAIEKDQLRAPLWNGFGIALMNSGQFEEADRAFARALEVDPSSEVALADRGITLVLAGRPAEGIVYCVRAQHLACQAMAHHALGDPGQSQRALDAMLANEVTERGAYSAAMVHAFRGEPDEAFRWLDRSYALHSHNLGQVAGDISFRSLHGDPRWRAFLVKMGLPLGSGATTATAVEPASATPSIAVLPFADMSPKHDQEYFADGVAEEIRNALAQVDGLKVIGRTSSFSFKGKTDDLKTIGQKLGVENVLEGSLRRDGNTVRITAQLIRVADGTHLWSESYDKKTVAILKVQEEIARAVTGALKVKLLPADRARPGATRALDPEAYRLFLLGRSLVLQRTEESSRRAIAALEGAIAIDPGMGQAHAWVSIAAWGASQATSGDERRGFLSRQRAEADLAVATAPNLSTAYAARGFVRMTHDWDWDGARRDIDKAVALDPHDQFALDMKANLESALGRFPEALDLGRRAVDLDPLNEEATLNLGWFQLRVGDLAEARRMARRALEIHPGSNEARALLAHADLRGGDARGALEGFEQIRAEGKMRGLPGVAAAAYSLGKEEQSLAALAELERQAGDQQFLIGSVHAWRGDKDEAFRWLDKARREHDVRMMMVKWWPLLGPIRGDPRYTALLKKLNLPVE
jgi:TolB-like protein/Flp pilus assembly protein TadD